MMKRNRDSCVKWIFHKAGYLQQTLIILWDHHILAQLLMTSQTHAVHMHMQSPPHPPTHSTQTSTYPLNTERIIVLVIGFKSISPSSSLPQFPPLPLPRRSFISKRQVLFLGTFFCELIRNYYRLWVDSRFLDADIIMIVWSKKKKKKKTLINWLKSLPSPPSKISPLKTHYVWNELFFFHFLTESQNIRLVWINQSAQNCILK